MNFYAYFLVWLGIIEELWQLLVSRVSILVFADELLFLSVAFFSRKILCSELLGFPFCSPKAPLFRLKHEFSIFPQNLNAPFLSASFLPKSSLYFQSSFFAPSLSRIDFRDNSGTFFSPPKVTSMSNVLGFRTKSEIPF